MESFWKKVCKGAADECWPWLASTARGGYGQFNNPRLPTGRAHKIAYILTKGDVPEGLVVRHTCDNRLCCNPAHLIVGTYKENSGDMVERNRQASGAKNGTAKLTDADVLAIRESPSILRVLAERYAVSEATISRIKNRKNWAHLK